jgi:hypothetical protein
MFTLSYLVSCTSGRVYIHKPLRDWSSKLDTLTQPEHRFYLVGDAGKVASDGSPNLVLNNLKGVLGGEKQTRGRSTVIYLGDNIYPYGLPDSAVGLAFVEATQALKRQTDAVSAYSGNVYFAPGNHDWANGKAEGWENLKRQERWVEQRLDNQDRFLPSNGCPGPVVRDVSSDLALVFIDTQWWLQTKAKPGAEQCPEAASEAAFIQALDETLTALKGKRVLLVGHHTMYSNGTHGGRIPFKHWVFPFLLVNKYAWVPFPVLGIPYGLYRSCIGHPQDEPHPRYRRLKKQLTALLSRFPSVTYVGGHDHNLQLHQRNGNIYIVSGSGSKQDVVARGHQALFTYPGKGYATLDYLSDSQRITFWKPHSDGPGFEPLFQYTWPAHR